MSSAGKEISNPQVFLDISINGSPPERIVIELFANFVPKTAENFRALCVGNKGTGKTTGKPLHYKGCVFHTIYEGFVAQGGDFENQNGTGGESIYGGTFEDESYELKHGGPGILSMASAGPNLNGSRFFITFRRQRFLDGCHVVFGKVIKGMETVHNMERLGTQSGEPTGLVVITDCGELLQVRKDEPEANLQKDNDLKLKSKCSSSEDEKANPTDFVNCNFGEIQTRALMRKYKEERMFDARHPSAGEEISNPQVFLDISINESPPERIVIELFANVVPKTAENFRALCVGNKGTGKTTGKPLHYKGCVFRRIIKGFFAEVGGDVENQNGTAGESIYGGTFEDESYELKHSGPGILTMASAGPNLNGSRFLICFSRQRSLDGCHVVFGKVIKGMETVQNIERLGTPSGEPTGLVVVTDCGEILQDKNKNVIESVKLPSSSVTKGEPEANLHKDNDSERSSKRKRSSIFFGDEEANRPSSSGLPILKEEPIAKLQKDNDSKKFEPSDEKLEATLKNNVLVTSGNDREVTSEKLSSNPHQHSDDPSKSRYTEELARDHSPRLQRLEDLTQWQTRAMIDIAKAMKVKLAPLPPTGRRSS